MTFTLQQLATTSGGELVGDPSLQIMGAASLGDATPGEISFFANRKYVALLRKTRASAVFVPPDFTEPITLAQIRVANPAKAFEQVVVKFAPKPITFAPGIHPTAVVDPSAQIGADGFGFEMVDGRQQKIQQLGIVQIDDDVEIGANTTVDRARFGQTWIQEGVKIDNLVQIAHNVVIGKNSVIVAQTGISGSTRVGERVMMGGQVGIVGHLEIGDGTAIGAQSGVSKSLPGGVWFGSPAVPLGEAKQQIAWIHRLGKLFAHVKEIEKKLGL